MSDPHMAADNLSDIRRADLLLPVLPLKHPWVINPLPHSTFKFLQYTFQQLIPGATVLLFPSTSPSSTVHGKRSVTMRGTIAIIHPKWRHAMVRSKSDKSGLSIITKITFRISSSNPSVHPQIFEIIGAYIPPRASHSAGACTLQQRLQDYLASSSANPHSTITPRAYAQTVVQKWFLRGQAKGRFVGITGDLNGSADLGAPNNNNIRE
jgi:hypothetical protein